MPIATPEPTAAASSGRRRAGVLASVALIGLASLWIGGCGRHAPQDPELRKRLISVDGEAFTRFLSRLVRLEGTPIAREARGLLARLDACPEVWGEFEIDADAEHDVETDANANTNANAASSIPLDPAALGCRNDASVDPALRDLVKAHRGDHAGLVFWPLGEDGRVEITFDVDRDAGLEIDGFFVPPSNAGAFSLFVPGEEPPEKAVLDPSNTLVDLRMRPAGGIHLASLIPADSQADRLFALKGRLLEGALLSGTWEFAIVAPVGDGQVPLAVGALHHRGAKRVEQALSEALDQLEHSWPIHRSSRSFSAADGARYEGGCFTDLPLLPELAPCWVVTPDALLIGYRGDAIDIALAPPAVSSPRDAAPDLVGASRLDIHFDRLSQLDERIAPEAGVTRLGDLFSRFDVGLRGEASGRVAVQARLRSIP